LHPYQLPAAIRLALAVLKVTEIDKQIAAVIGVILLVNLTDNGLQRQR